MKQTLRNKWMASFGALMVALTLSISAASANSQQSKPQGRQDRVPNVPANPGKPQLPTKVALKCEPYNHSDVSAIITITNNSGQTIAQGTNISWQLKGKKGSSTVNGGLQPNKSLDINTGLHWTDNGPCSAYFLKK